MKAIYVLLISAVLTTPVYARGGASGAAGGMGHGHGGASAGSSGFGGSSGGGGTSGASGGNSNGTAMAWFNRGPQNIEESPELTAQAERILNAGINRR